MTARPRVFALSFANDIKDNLGMARDLGPAAVFDLAVVLVLAAVLTLDLALDLGRTLGRPLESALERALERAVARPRTRARDGAVPVLYRPAARVAGAAAGLLAEGDRGRYGEEWRAELDSLAGAGAGWAAQLRHALRLLAAAVPLRHALAGAERRRRAAR